MIININTLQVGTEVLVRNNGIGRALSLITVDRMSRAEFPDPNELPEIIKQVYVEDELRQGVCGEC